MECFYRLLTENSMGANEGLASGWEGETEEF